MIFFFWCDERKRGERKRCAANTQNMNMIGSLLRKKKNKEREKERECQGDNFPRVTENDFSRTLLKHKRVVLYDFCLLFDALH